MHTGQPHRLRGFSYLGFHRYFLTFCTFERRSHFVDGSVVAVALAQILRVAAEEQFAILAYTFMPDHAHLLIEGMSVDADARRFMTRAKQSSGYAVARRDGRRLWQRYGYEHVLRDDESAVGVARYILENPVRARLLTDEQPLRDYAWNSYIRRGGDREAGASGDGNDDGMDRATRANGVPTHAGELSEGQINYQ